MASPPPATEQPAVAPSLDDLLLKGIGTSSQPKQKTLQSGNAMAKPLLSKSRRPDDVDARQTSVLGKIEAQMRQVQQRLRENDLSSGTLASEQQIVAELDRLITELERKCCQSSSSSCKLSSATKKKKPADPKANAGRQAARGKAEAVGNGGETTSSQTELQTAVKKVWGQLPDRLRRQIENASHVEFLPRYRRLIEDYYRRLAEQPRDVP